MFLPNITIDVLITEDKKLETGKVTGQNWSLHNTKKKLLFLDLLFALY